MPKKKAKRPLTVSIHGSGIDIDAKISNADELLGFVRTLTDQTRHRDADEHDFDAVQRVIKVGSDEVLQAIANLVRVEQEDRRRPVS